MPRELLRPEAGNRPARRCGRGSDQRPRIARHSWRSPLVDQIGVSYRYRKRSGFSGRICGSAKMHPFWVSSRLGRLYRSKVCIVGRSSIKGDGGSQKALANGRSSPTTFSTGISMRNDRTTRSIGPATRQLWRVGGAPGVYCNSAGQAFTGQGARGRQMKQED